MQVIGNNLLPDVEIRDHTGRPPAALDLFILAGSNAFQYCTFDYNKSRFPSIIDYQQDKDISLKDLRKIIAEDELLSKGEYRQIKICIYNERSTLIPAALYSSDASAEVHKMNFPADSFATIYSDRLKGIDAQIVYDCKNGLRSLLKEYFDAASFFHFSTPFVEGALTMNKHSEAKVITINVFRNTFQMAVSGNQQLFFYNSFRYRSNEDFLYHILSVCDQLELNPQTIRTELAGMITENNDIFRLSSKFIGDLGFVSSEGKHNLRNGDIPAHRYFVLFNGQLCG